VDEGRRRLALHIEPGPARRRPIFASPTPAAMSGSLPQGRDTSSACTSLVLAGALGTPSSLEKRPALPAEAHTSVRPATWPIRLSRIWATSSTTSLFPRRLQTPTTPLVRSPAPLTFSQHRALRPAPAVAEMLKSNEMSWPWLSRHSRIALGSGARAGGPNVSGLGAGRRMGLTDADNLRPTLPRFN